MSRAYGPEEKNKLESLIKEGGTVMLINLMDLILVATH